MPFSGSPSGSYYPGINVVDFAGSDTYGSGQPFSSMYSSTVSAVGSSSLPLSLHETGIIPDPGAMFNNNAAPWILFSTWCDTWLRDNPTANIQRAYDSPYTITRDELPSFD